MPKQKRLEIDRRRMFKEKTTIAIYRELKDKLDILMVNKKIPVWNEDNEIQYKKYSMSDLIYDLLYIYAVVVKGIKEDEELEKAYGYKTVKPYYITKFMYSIGLKPDGFEDTGDLEFDEVDEDD